MLASEGVTLTGFFVTLWPRMKKGCPRRLMPPDGRNSCLPATTATNIDTWLVMTQSPKMMPSQPRLIGVMALVSLTSVQFVWCLCVYAERTGACVCLQWELVLVCVYSDDWCLCVFTERTGTCVCLQWELVLVCVYSENWCLYVFTVRTGACVCLQWELVLVCACSENWCLCVSAEKIGSTIVDLTVYVVAWISWFRFFFKSENRTQGIVMFCVLFWYLFQPHVTAATGKKKKKKRY